MFIVEIVLFDKFFDSFCRVVSIVQFCVFVYADRGIETIDLGDVLTDEL